MIFHSSQRCCCGCSVIIQTIVYQNEIYHIVQFWKEPGFHVTHLLQCAELSVCLFLRTPVHVWYVSAGVCSCIYTSACVWLRAKEKEEEQKKGEDADSLPDSLAVSHSNLYGHMITSPSLPPSPENTIVYNNYIISH